MYSSPKVELQKMNIFLTTQENNMTFITMIDA